jgi:hypothetical protein
MHQQSRRTQQERKEKGKKNTASPEPVEYPSDQKPCPRKEEKQNKPSHLPLESSRKEL